MDTFYAVPDIYTLNFQIIHMQLPAAGLFSVCMTV